MGIKGLSTFLKNYAPNGRRVVPTAFFANRKIAIDGYVLSYAYMATAIAAEAVKIEHAKVMELNQDALTERWLSRWLSTITMMKEAKMHPYVVLDGPEVPPEKTATRAKRHTGKENVRDKMKLLVEQIAQEDLESNYEARRELVGLMSRDISVTEQHLNRLRKLLEAVGVPVIQAKGEGEALCATLVREKKCYAIYTKDSDAGAYLAPFVINSIENPTFDTDGRHYQTCEVIYYNQVISTIKLTPEQFVDLCIMCGTDYNDNVPGWGPVKCYKLLLEYGRLEQIPHDKYDSTSLNYIRIREIFKDRAEIKSGSLIEPLVETGSLTRLLASYGLLRNASRLLALLRASDVNQINTDLNNQGEITPQLELSPADLL